MKNLLFVRIPSTCICFTLIVLGNAGLNLLHGYSKSLWGPALFLWLICCQLIDMLISKIEFQKWSHYCVIESVILYLLTLFVYRIFFWDSFNLSLLTSFTVIFLITDGFVFWYFRERQKIQAEEINRLIHARQNP